jgi:AbiV family abortive infection protein
MVTGKYASSADQPNYCCADMMNDKEPVGKYQDAIRACVRNGCVLLDDADLLRGWDRYGTAYAITILAEEEFSKAFLLYLVQDGAIPWIPEVRRATRNHECKHLLSLLMDHLAEKGEQWWANRLNGKPEPTEQRIPPQLISAINLFRHEKIGKWNSPSWDVLEPGDYDPATKRVLEGSVDRAKQSAIYVNIASDGTTLTTPNAVSASQTVKEMERCTRLKELATDMEHGFVSAFREYAALKNLISAVFDPNVIAVATMEDNKDAQP